MDYFEVAKEILRVRYLNQSTPAPGEIWICSWCGEEFTDDELKYYPGMGEVICGDCATAGGHVIL